MSDYIIKSVSYDIIEEAFYMVMKVFMEFDAPDYSKEGIEEFRKEIIESEKFKNRFKTGDQIMIGAFKEDKIIGVLATSVRNHISLFFVEKEYHRMGIATALFEELIKKIKQENSIKITLNSSLYAVPFYSKIGFVATDIEKVSNGIRYIPMEIVV